jgi:hypothetical protein
VAHRRDFVIWVNADVTVFTPAQPDGVQLEAVFAGQPVVGGVVWDRGQERTLRSAARTLAAAIRFSRSGCQADCQEALLHFVQLVPCDGTTDPLVLATPARVSTRAGVTGVVRAYEWRRTIGTTFGVTQAWGLGRFVARSWPAIDVRWLVAVAYVLLLVAARAGLLAVFRDQAIALLKRLAVVGGRLAVGTLAEAIGLDYQRHRRAWTTVRLT